MRKLALFLIFLLLLPPVGAWKLKLPPRSTTLAA